VQRRIVEAVVRVEGSPVGTLLGLVGAMAVGCSGVRPPEPAVGGEQAMSTPSTARPDARALDVAGVLELPGAWSVAGASGPIAVHSAAAPGVTAVLDDGARVVRVDAATGSTVWSIAAPPGGRFLSLLATGGLVVVGRSVAGKEGYQALDGSDGRVVWERAGRLDLHAGLDATGLSREDRGCVAILVDPATGRDFAAPFTSSTYEEWLISDPGQRRTECAVSFALLGFMHGRALVGWSQRTAPASAGIAAHDPAGPRRELSEYDWPFGAGNFAAVGREPVTGVFYTQGHEAILLRFAAATATRAWEWRGELRRDGCVEAPWPWLRATRGPAGHEAAILVQDCVEAALVDATTGETVWRAAEREGIAVIAGEPVGAALPTWRRIGRPYRLLSTDGRPLALVAPPAGTREVYPAPDGLLVVGEHDIAMLGWDHAYRWAWQLDVHALAPLGEAIIVTIGEWAAPTQLVLDVRTGSPLGQVRGRLLTTLASDGLLVADGAAMRAVRVQR
jgi:hypothetical protein